MTLRENNFRHIIRKNKKQVFFHQKLCETIANLRLIILKIPILTTWITGSKKVWINFDFE